MGVRHCDIAEVQRSLLERDIEVVEQVPKCFVSVDFFCGQASDFCSEILWNGYSLLVAVELFGSCECCESQYASEVQV